LGRWLRCFNLMQSCLAWLLGSTVAALTLAAVSLLDGMVFGDPIMCTPSLFDESANVKCNVKWYSLLWKVILSSIMSTMTLAMCCYCCIIISHQFPVMNAKEVYHGLAVMPRLDWQCTVMQLLDRITRQNWNVFNFIINDKHENMEYQTLKKFYMWIWGPCYSNYVATIAHHVVNVCGESEKNVLSFLLDHAFDLPRAFCSYLW